MKLRVFRTHLLTTLNYYNQELAQKFGPLALSEAAKENIRIEAKKIQYRMSRQQKTNSWLVPVKVNFSDMGQYNVVPENENDILIID